jgi:hypothetical protein
MLSIMSMYYYLELINVSGSEINKNNTSSISVRKKYAILLILNILIIYTHYFGFFILSVQLIYLLYNKQLLARFWKQLLMSIGIIMLFYIPNLFTFINRFLESSIHGTWVKPPDGIESLYFMIKNFSNAPVVATLVITSCAMIKYVLIRKNENTKDSFKLIIFWFVFIFFFMFAISFIIPMFLRRYLMPGAVAFCLVIGISIDYLVRYRWYKFIIPGIICFAFIVTVQPAVPHKKDVKATIKKVKALKNQKTLVYLCPNWFDMNFVYYYNRSCFKNYNEKRIKENMYKCLKTDNIFPIRNQKQIDTSKFSKFNKVIYLDIHADSHYPDNGILKKLDRNLILLNKYDSKKLFDIYEYKIK